MKIKLLLRDGKMSKEEATRIFKDWLLRKLYWSNKNITPTPYEVLCAINILTEEEVERINREVKDLWD